MQLYVKKNQSRVKMLEEMLLDGTKTVQYYSENNLDVNYEKSNIIHFHYSIDENVSLNCLLNDYDISESNNIKLSGLIIREK